MKTKDVPKPFFMPNKYSNKAYKLFILKMSITILIGLILFIILLVQVIKILIKYDEGPTYISTVVSHQKEAEFPAISICPNENFLNMTRLMEHGYNDTKFYNDARKGRAIWWKSNQTGMSNWELFDYVTFSSADLIKKIKIRLFEAHPTRGLYITLNSSDPSITSQPHRKFGKCWTINFEKEFRDYGIYFIKMEYNLPVKQYFHHEAQFLDLSGRMGYVVNIGEIHTTQLNYQDMKMLDKRNTPKGKFSCKDIVYDRCMYDMMTKLMLKAANCTSPWIKDRTNKICDEPEKVNETFWITFNRVTNQKKDCPIPCHFLLIDVNDKNYSFNKTFKHAESSFYIAPRVIINEERYLYTGLSLFAEVGGYVGLLTGFSFYNLAGIIGYFIQKKIDKTIDV